MQHHDDGAGAFIDVGVQPQGPDVGAHVAALWWCRRAGSRSRHRRRGGRRGPPDARARRPRRWSPAVLQDARSTPGGPRCRAPSRPRARARVDRRLALAAVERTHPQLRPRSPDQRAPPRYALAGQRDHRRASDQSRAVLDEVEREQAAGRVGQQVDLLGRRSPRAPSRRTAPRSPTSAPALAARRSSRRRADPSRPCAGGSRGTGSRRGSGSSRARARPEPGPPPEPSRTPSTAWKKGMSGWVHIASHISRSMARDRRADGARRHVADRRNVGDDDVHQRADPHEEDPAAQDDEHDGENVDCRLPCEWRDGSASMRPGRRIRQASAPAHQGAYAPRPARAARTAPGTRSRRAGPSAARRSRW